jgi:hypothetical protein
MSSEYYSGNMILILMKGMFGIETLLLSPFQGSDSRVTKYNRASPYPIAVAPSGPVDMHFLCDFQVSNTRTLRPGIICSHICWKNSLINNQNSLTICTACHKAGLA